MGRVIVGRVIVGRVNGNQNEEHKNRVISKRITCLEVKSWITSRHVIRFEITLFLCSSFCADPSNFRKQMFRSFQQVLKISYEFAKTVCHVL